MGYYIETDSSKNKAQWILENCPGTSRWDGKTVLPGTVPVVVVDNGPFEAAGIAFNQREYFTMNSPNDFRPKTLLLVPKHDIIKLCPQVADRLEWP